MPSVNTRAGRQVNTWTCHEALVQVWEAAPPGGYLPSDCHSESLLMIPLGSCVDEVICGLESLSKHCGRETKGIPVVILASCSGAPFLQAGVVC